MRQGFVFSIIVLAVLCAPVWGIGGDMGVGTEPLTDGSEQYPYLIEDLADFDTFSGDSTYWAEGVHTTLMADIDLSGRTFTQAVIAPDTDVSFIGVFDGGGHKISDLTIENSTNYIGFFGKVGTGGQVKNLGVYFNVTGGNYVAGLVGYNRGTLTSCCAIGSVAGANSYTGGLVGYNKGLLDSCYMIGSVNSSGYYVGGLVGYNTYGMLTSSYAAGSVSGNSYVGGLVGTNYLKCTLVGCYADTSVNGTVNVGGLVGDDSGLSNSIFSCYANGSISGTVNVGGLVGAFSSSISTIAFCYATGPVSGTSNVGGFLGAYSEGIIRHCFWDVQTSEIPNGVGNTILDPEEISGKTTAEMKNIQIYLDADWLFVHEGLTLGDWVMPENDYPQLTWQAYPLAAIPDLKGLTEEQARNALEAVGLLSGGTYTVYDESISSGLTSETCPQSGSVVHAGLTPVHILLAKKTKYNGGDGVIVPYEIIKLDDWFDLMAHSKDWDKSFILKADIDLDGIPFVQAPIAPNTNLESPFRGTKFTGVFNGDGHVIANLAIIAPMKEYTGLFGSIGVSGRIENLGIESAKIVGNANTGSLCGQNYYGNITNCYVKGDVKGIRVGSNDVGGLCGNNKGTITDCFTQTDVSEIGGHIGGLCGNNERGNLINCYATGNINGLVVTGGLCGNNIRGNIIDCYATGNVSGTNEVGGLCGHNEGGIDSITNSYATGNVYGSTDFVGGLCGTNYRGSGNVTNSYATGAVSGNNYVGGLCGSNSYRDIINCYAVGMVHGMSDYVGSLCGGNYGANITDCYFLQGIGPNNGMGISLSDDQMKQQASYENWDFENIWWIDEGNDYPRLWLEITNTPPIADAGDDITVYGFVDGYALIQLDGTDSYDEDGDALTYYWYNDANELIGDVAEPNVVLSVGEHEIEYEITLIVNDGTEDSEPNSCMVTVLPAVETEAKLTPQSLNRKSNQPYVIGRLLLAGFSEVDIDPNEPMVLMPGDIVAERVEILPGNNGNDSITLVGFFDHAALMGAITEDGEAEITLTAKLLTGQWVYGRDTVKVK